MLRRGECHHITGAWTYRLKVGVGTPSSRSGDALDIANAKTDSEAFDSEHALRNQHTGCGRIVNAAVSPPLPDAIARTNSSDSRRADVGASRDLMDLKDRDD